jgi:ABC-type dipeptide/oligopeptide/nickel transport system permease component
LDCGADAHPQSKKANNQGKNVKLLWYLCRRIIYLTLQVLGVVTLTFFLVHLIPGDPAIKLAGQGATPQTVHQIQHNLGLDKPLPQQYAIYVGNVVHGDLGNSIITNQPVARDLRDRLPATLELVTVSMFFVVIIGIPLGVITALRPRGVASKGTFVYGMVSGALPDFWFGLVFIFIFFFSLHWLPAPLGRLPLEATPPAHRTGFYLIDSLLAGDTATFKQVVLCLILPVATLVITNMGNVVKIMRSSIEEVTQSDFLQFARACGLPRWVVLRYMVRNSLAPVITVIAFTYGLLLGGTILVETVFSWGGMGSYAVQAVKGGDYAAITGFVMFVAVFMALVYLVLDLVYAWVDPRIQYS